MEGAHGSFGITRKQLEHVLGLKDDVGGDGMGNSNVVDKKRKECDPTVPYWFIYSSRTKGESANNTDHLSIR